MFLPNSIDLTPDNKLVEPAQIGEHGYAENINFNLQLSVTNFDVFINYYGEDDTFLDDSLIKQIVLQSLGE